MKYIAVDKDYQEAFAHILERLSVEKDDDIVGMATTVLVGNGQWISFFWNCSTRDKMAISGIMQSEAQDDLDEETHWDVRTEILEAIVAEGEEMEEEPEDGD